MKRLAATILLWLVACSVGIIEPKPEPEPIPIEIEPVLVKDAEAWTINKTVVAYYQKATLPDGSKIELKSRTPLTIEQWQAKADALWQAQKTEKQDRPEPCSRCGGTGIEP